MLYRNKKTGAVIETDCHISGGDWELGNAASASDVSAGSETVPPADKPKRKGKATV